MTGPDGAPRVTAVRAGVDAVDAATGTMPERHTGPVGRWLPVVAAPHAAQHRAGCRSAPPAPFLLERRPCAYAAFDSDLRRCAYSPTHAVLPGHGSAVAEGRIIIAEGTAWDQSRLPHQYARGREEIKFALVNRAAARRRARRLPDPPRRLPGKDARSRVLAPRADASILSQPGRVGMGFRERSCQVGSPSLSGPRPGAGG